MMESLVTEYDQLGHVRERSGAILPRIAPSNVYPTRDGIVMIGANQDTVFARLCTAMQSPDLSNDARYRDHVARGTHQQELDAIIAQWTATLGTRELLYSMWLHNTDNRKVVRLVRETMSDHGFEMWSRGAREVAAAYLREGSPLRAFAALDPPVPALHMYAQPTDPAFLQDQQHFAESHPWYSVRKLQARSHFPMLEVPREMAASIEAFVTASSGQAA